MKLKDDTAPAGELDGPILGPAYIVAADPALRETLARALHSAAAQVVEFASLDSFLARVGTLPPGCIVSGLCIDTPDGVRLFRELADRSCPFPVVALTPPGDVALAVRAMKAGAADVVALPVRSEDLVEAVRLAVEARLRSGAVGSVPAAVRLRLARLTRRERQVLDAMVRGDGNKAIAHDLGISPRTVEVHRAKVMEKLACRSLPELVRLAVVAGMLRP